MILGNTYKVLFSDCAPLSLASVLTTGFMGRVRLSQQTDAQNTHSMVSNTVIRG